MYSDGSWKGVHTNRTTVVKYYTIKIKCKFLMLPEIYTGWRESHFTIFNIYYTTTNTAIKMRYIWNEKENLEVFLFKYDTFKSSPLLFKHKRILRTLFSMPSSKISGVILLIYSMMLFFNSWRVLGIMM